MTYLLIFEQEPLAGRWRAIGKNLAPYAALTLVFLAWRAVVLGGMGGYSESDLQSSGAPALAQIIFSYFSDLLYPADLFSLLLAPLSPSARTWLIYLMCGVLTLLVLLYSRRMVDRLEARSGREQQVLKSLLISAGLAAVALLILNRYPVGPEIGGSRLPWLTVILYLFLAVAALALVALDQRRRLARCCRSSQGRLAAWSAVWLLLPLAVYLPAQTFSHRSMYIALVPFAILLALTLKQSYHEIRRAKGSSLAQVIALALALLLAISFPVSTALIKREGEWAAVSNLTELLLERLGPATSGLPVGSQLELYDLPKGIAFFGGGLTYAQEVSYPLGYGIESWLALTAPDKDFRVAMHDRIVLSECPDDIALRTEPAPTGGIDLKLGYRYGSCTSRR